MQLHIREIPKQVALAFAAKTNLLFVGAPGVGKSRQVEACADKMKERVKDFQYIKLDVPSMSPPDVGAYMPNMKTGLLDYYPNGTLPNVYTQPKGEGIIFFDEVLSGDNATTKLFRKYINDEDINGKLRKPPGFIVVAASNRMLDRAGVMQQDRAFMRRWEQIEIYSDAKGNIEFAERVDFHPSIQTFFKEFPDLIDNYEQVFFPGKATTQGDKDKAANQSASEEGKRGIWANMGGWERLSRLEYAAESMNMELLPQRIIGNVGTAVGMQYVTHRAMVGRLASVDQIVHDPKGVDVPEKMDELYAQLVMLAMRVDIKDMKAVSLYLARVTGDMKAMCINRMLSRSKRQRDTFNLTPTKEYQAWMADPSFTDLLMARG